MKKFLVCFCLILTFTLVFSSTAVFADNISPRGAIIYKTFTGYSKKVSSTHMIKVVPYGTSIGKEVGTVTISATLLYDEVWEVNQNGNKIRLVELTNKRFASPSRNYNLKLNCSVDEISFTTTSDRKQITVYGLANYSAFGQSVQDSYQFSFNA